MIDKPWINGPRELLVHGLEHLKNNTDFDYRMGLICIDNSIELAIKTYLGLPKRINNIENLSRNKLEELSKTFPSLIDGLEHFASDKLQGLDLGDIEWYHRVRNELYHKGNGITVEKSLAIAYSEIAKILLKNLFNIDTEQVIEKIEKEIVPVDNEERLLGNFVKKWNEFEKAFSDKLQYKSKGSLFLLIKELYDKKVIDNNTYEIIMQLVQYRNNIVHSHAKPSAIDVEFNLKRMDDIINSLK
jgi:hypothetical protein